MTPIKFPEANIVCGPPAGMDESQVMTIHAHHYEVKNPQSNLDGQKCVVVAWQPDAQDLARLQAGGAIYLNMFYGLMPHCITTNFKEATSI